MSSADLKKRLSAAELVSSTSADQMDLSLLEIEEVVEYIESLLKVKLIKEIKMEVVL